MASGSVTAEGYQGRLCTFSWSSTQSGNVVTVNWTVTLSGGSVSQYITSQCYFDIDVSKCTCDKGSRVWVLSYDTERMVGRVQIGSGTFKLTTTANDASFGIRIRFSSYYHDTNGDPRYTKYESWGGFSYTPPNTVRVYNGSSWVKATPYVYNGSSWIKATAYVYNGSKWVAFSG